MVDSTNLPDVDINQIATDLNGKADRDLLNLDTSLFHVEKIFDNNISRGDTITFDNAISDYDFLIAIIGIQIFVGKGNSSRMKLTSIWAGSDSDSVTGYKQIYVLDLGNINGNTWKVWNLGWAPMNDASSNFTQVSKRFKIYGIKIR